MKAFRKLGTAVAAALVLCACSSFIPKKEKPEEENLYPKDYKAMILDRLRAQLTDPKGIRAALLAEPVLKPRGVVTRYIACIRFDSKDERGQYQGNKEYAAFFFAGELTQIADAAPDVCDKSAYQLGKNPRVYIGIAARRERHDYRDGARRIGLRPRSA